MYSYSYTLINGVKAWFLIIPLGLWFYKIKGILSFPKEGVGPKTS